MPPLLVVHRLPNSAARCSALAAAGACGFELDIQLRGDEIVVSHYLPFLQIPSWFEHDGTRFRWRGGRLLDPGFVEALARVPGDARIVLDPKEMRRSQRRRLATAVTTALAALPNERGRCAVTTNDPTELLIYRMAGIATWRTVGAAHELAAVLEDGSLDDPGVAVRHTLLTADAVARLHSVAPTVAAWTVNDVPRARKLADIGVDVITTDRVEMLAAALRD